MADLKTDYKDDVLDTEVNELRKYQMIQNEDGTVSFVDVTEYLQVGDSFGSDILNQIVAKITTDVIDALADVLTNTENGVLVGANAVKELKNTLQNAIDAKVTNSFTPNRAVYVDANGNLVASGTVTSTELGCLGGVTSNIQAQLSAKLSKSGGQITGQITTSEANVSYETNGNIYSPIYGGNLYDLLSIHSTTISNSQVNIVNLQNDKLSKSGGTMTGRLNTDRLLGMGLDSSSYSSAPIVINADTVNNQAIRSGIGFHNQGVNGTCLYLDLDGALKHIDSAGVNRVLMDSRNFQYDASTQTLNIIL